MNKTSWMIFVIVLIILASGIFYGARIFSAKQNTISNNQNNNPIVNLTKESLPGFLNNQEVIKALPSDAVISLKFYNFNTGERVIEEEYTIRKGAVTEGAAVNPDLEIMLASKYLPELGDFCGVINTAKANGDFSADLKISQTNFLWKYKSVIGYRNCFGF